MPVDEYLIDKDIKVVCVPASSFPDGIQEAHRKLRSLVVSPGRSTFYGISYPDKNGNIIYKAATDALSEKDARELKLETFIIRRGKYITEVLANWQKDETLVGKTFEKLLSDPGIDKRGHCLEIYFNDRDMRCAVPLDAAFSSRRRTTKN